MVHVIRRVFLALFLPIMFVSTSASAQDSIQSAPVETHKTLSGFQGVAWGDTVVKARSVLDKKFTYDARHSDPKTLVYSGGQMGGRDISMLLLLFGKGGFTKAAVYFDAKESRVIDDYNEFKSMLSAKYGEPSNDFKFFESPYEEGDGYETQAIRLRKATFASYWRFPVPGKEDNILGLKITDDLQISVVYENSSRMDEVVNSTKVKNAKDF
jgi:hypothetical protein